MITRNTIALLLLCFSLAKAQVTTQTFAFTGTVQTFTVPACVFQVSVDLRGAQGGWANDKVPANGPGGLGGRAWGVLTVTPNQVINILVGGQGFTTGIGGYNGGGNGAYGSPGSSCFGGYAGGGGGGTDIRIGGLGLSNRVAAAGGGGGAGRDYCNGTCQPCGCGGNGGCGGGLTGMPGMSAFCVENMTFYPGNMMNGGSPGTQTAGGLGGPYDNSTSQAAGIAGTNGSLGIGGDGGGGTYDVAGGGGGGGWYGGGGGGSATSGSGVGGGGGGGGSSYIANLSNGQTSTCVNAGNGVAIFSYDYGGNNIAIVASPSAICSGQSTTITASGQNSYTWSTGSNSNSIVVSPGTNTYYVASGTNSTGCVSTNTVLIAVDANVPTISAFASPTVLCAGTSATLTASGAYTYTWSNGLTNGAAFTPTVTNSYSVTGANGCGTSTGVVTISVQPQYTVTATAINPTICLGNTTTLSASGAQTYSWSNNQPNNSSFTPTATSIYTVFGSGALCTGSAAVAVTVVPFSGPVVSATPPATTICSGSTITLTASGVNTYTWNTGANSQNLAVSPTSNSSYTVFGTNSAGCRSSTIATVLVDPNGPALVVNTSTNAICPGKTVTISATGATNYSFTGGISNNTSFSPGTTTTYTITGANACGSMSVATTVTVNTAPSVSATAVTPTICSGNAATVLATGANSYSWTSNIQNGQSFYPSSTSNYTVTGYSAFGCTNTAIVAVTVYLTPSLTPIASPPLICIGNSATITSSGATSYSWQPGGSNSTSIVVSPNTTTTYTLTKSTANCSDVKTVTVIVNQLPSPSILASPSVVCSTHTTVLQAGGAATFTWSAPNYSNTGSSVTVTPASTTVYSLTASDGTCVNTASVQVVTNPNPTITLSPSSAMICYGQSATLTAGGGNNYTWTPNVSTTGQAIVSPTTTSLYSIVGDNSFSCTSIAQQAIIVNPNPSVNVFTNKPLVCSGQPATLTVSGATSYSWDSGAQGASTVVNPTTSTVYTVTGWLSTMCSNTKTVSVNVFEPDFNVPSGLGACLGGSVTLTASGANSYTWNGNQPFSSIVVSPTINTVYVVSATSSSNAVNCISTKTVSVTITPNPIVSASAVSTIVCKGSKASLSGAGAATYSWSGGLTGQTVTPVITQQTTFTVTGTNTAGCSSTATVLVKMSTCIGIAEFNQEENAGLRIYPNPNTGNFMIESQIDLDLVIINELGQTVKYVSLSEDNHHKVKISELAKGAYFITGKKGDAVIREKIVVIE